jgi:hypothetical protein
MPTTWKQHEKSLSEPGLCELLPIRDYLDNVMIRLSGEFVAGYVLKGAVSYFADDAGLNTIKTHLEALLRTIDAVCELSDSTGNVFLNSHRALQKSRVLCAVDSCCT